MPDLAALLSLFRLALKDRQQLVLENIALRHQLAVYMDHIIPMGEGHLVRALREYQAYFNESRTHYSLDGNAPIARRVQAAGEVSAAPVLGGLHHRYSRAA